MLWQHPLLKSFESFRCNCFSAVARPAMARAFPCKNPSDSFVLGTLCILMLFGLGFKQTRAFQATCAFREVLCPPFLEGPEPELDTNTDINLTSHQDTTA